MKTFFVLLWILIGFRSAEAQYIFKSENLAEPVSILNYAVIADAGTANFSIQQVRSNHAGLQFKKLNDKYGNLGFTHHNYWVKIAFKNSMQVPVLYYLQTAEPVTDNVNLYLINEQGKVSVQQSGDKLDFSKRILPFRQTVFQIQLKPGEWNEAFIELKNDGEKNSLPLTLISQQTFLKAIYAEQFGMGIFYGLLFVIAITYLFFYFALNELSFLYYSLYVTFMGLCQFALDGFYHQYIGESNSWINLHFVIVSAIFGCYFFGKYSELILDIKVNNTFICKLFKTLYGLLGVVMAGIVISPSFLKYSYPIINILTLIGMILIFISVFLIIYHIKYIDIFYTGGILILFITILGAILMNFGVFPEHFSMDNITKPGIGLEILALSLSMANRIRLLKTKKEELQTIALQKSEEMNDIKTYFLSNMSHELRTPLNAIIGLADVTETETQDLKAKANCGIIKDASYGLISSVNDILDFSRIEKGQLKLDQIQFNLNTILIRISNSTARLAQDKGLKFEFLNSLVENIVVTGDLVRLEQIIHNLLNNAVKFTKQGLVKLQVQSKIDQDIIVLQLIISDTGVGIPKEKLETVFDLFSQNNINNKRQFGGFGIGLSVVKALVELHNGTIKLESELEIGTTCEVSLTYPLVAIQPKPVVISNMKIVYDLCGKSILVVEDNKMNQLVIKMMLKNWKNTIISFADDGLQGLEVLKNQNIDLVLMDLQMPVMDGYDAIAAIRKGETGRHNSNIPIIVLTADVTTEAKEKVFDLGATDYMTKPVDQQLLYQKATEIFASAKVA